MKRSIHVGRNKKELFDTCGTLANGGSKDHAYQVSSNCNGSGSCQQWGRCHASLHLSLEFKNQCWGLSDGLGKHFEGKINSVHNRRLYVFQQESALSYMAKTTKEWIYNNLHDHVLLNMVYLTRPESNELSHMGHSWERGQSAITRI